MSDKDIIYIDAVPPMTPLKPSQDPEPSELPAPMPFPTLPDDTLPPQD